MPWSGDPLGVMMAPLAVMTVVLGRKKKHGKWATLIAVVVLSCTAWFNLTAFVPVQLSLFEEPILPVSTTQFSLPGTYAPISSLSEWQDSYSNSIKNRDSNGSTSCNNSNDSNCMYLANQLKEKAGEIYDYVKYGSLEPVEGLAMLVDEGMVLFNDDIRGMIWGMTYVINGFDINSRLLYKQVKAPPANKSYFIGQDWLPYKNRPEYNDTNWDNRNRGDTWIHSLRGDWKQSYWDKTANQGYHFWFYVALSYMDGSGVAHSANVYHEFLENFDNPDERMKSFDYINSPEDEAPPRNGKSWPDFWLGIKGIDLGVNLREISEINNIIYHIDCEQSLPTYQYINKRPGDWIRSNLKGD